MGHPFQQFLFPFLSYLAQYNYESETEHAVKGVHGPYTSIKVLGSTWLIGKVIDSYLRGPGFEPHWILWVSSWDCPWARHFRAQPSKARKA